MEICRIQKNRNFPFSKFPFSKSCRLASNLAIIFEVLHIDPTFLQHINQLKYGKFVFMFLKRGLPFQNMPINDELSIEDMKLSMHLVICSKVLDLSHFL